MPKPMADPCLEAVQADLDQARALLERATGMTHAEALDIWDAPAPDAQTTALLCYEGDCAKMTGRARPCPVHDAPAQAAEPELVNTGARYTPREYRPAMTAEQAQSDAAAELVRRAEDAEALIEQLDEALCSLLHEGNEIGEHSPRTHLDLFYAKQSAAEQPWRVNDQLEQAQLRAASAEATLAAVAAVVDDIPASLLTEEAAGNADDLSESNVAELITDMRIIRDLLAQGGGR